MSSYVLCLTASGGLPLFTRRKGEGESLPFSVVASLNGVHMFGKSLGVKLETTYTQEITCVWKEIEESIILIAAGYGVNKVLLDKLLITVSHAMIMVVGIDELRAPRNVDRLKRDLRICYPIIDQLLSNLDAADKYSVCTDLLGLSEVMLCPENSVLQNMLDVFCECVSSLFGCILIKGATAVATQSWWTLTPNERKLLAMMLSDGGLATTKDIPVFLPCKSPSVAFRLVSCVLVAGIEVCVLCGPTPSLIEVEQTAVQCWKGAIDLLRSAEQNFSLDAGVMGLLLVDIEAGKFMASRSQGKRLDMLRSFYYYAESMPQSKEMYWCSEYHKCHALRQGRNLLCVLYAAAVPTITMRLLTKQILKMFIQDKQLCW